MSKKLPLILLIAAIILIGGVAVFAKSRMVGPAMPPAANQVGKGETAQDLGDDEMVSGSLQELIKLGKNYTCSFNYSHEDGSATEGTVYISDSGQKVGGNFYTQFSAEQQAQGMKNADAHIIRDPEYTYFWSAQEKTGMKMKTDPADDSLFKPGTADKSDQQALDDQAKYDFKCKKWSPDAAKFTPPSDIQFTDLSGMMPAATGPSTSPGADSGMKIDCSVCNQAPEGESRQSCIQALKCL